MENLTFDVYEIINGLEIDYYYRKIYINTKIFIEYKKNILLEEMEEKYKKELIVG